MPSPTCEVKNGSGAYEATTNGVDVTPSNTITIKLVSGSGVRSWSCECIGTDDLSDADDVTDALVVDPLARTATFTAPAKGRALIFRSQVNGGVDINGEAQASYTTTFGVFTRTEGGKRVLATNATTESNEEFGWIAEVNELIRDGGGGVGNDMPPGWYSVVEYGAEGDGITDDSGAVRAAIAASEQFGRQGATIYFPPGIYRFASTVVLRPAVIVKGCTPYITYAEDTAVCRIKADALVTAFEVGRYDEDTETDGNCTHIHDLQIFSTVTAIPLWQAGHTYQVGDIVRRANDNRYYYECVDGGVSGGSEPDFSIRLIGSDTYPTGHQTTDNGVIWETRLHTGILGYRRVYVDRVHCHDFSNSGVTIHGDGIQTQGSNANMSALERVRVSQCGIGIEIGTGDGNVVKVDSCDVELPGYHWSGTGGVGYLDATFLGSVHINCHTVGGTGRAYYTTSLVGCSVFVGCYSEGGLPSYIRGLVLGGDHGAGFADDSPHTGFDPMDAFNAHPLWRRLGARDAAHDKTPTLFLDYRDGNGVNFLARHSTDSINGGGGGVIADRYEFDWASDEYWKQGDGGTYAMNSPPGYWITGFGGSTIRRGIGWSGSTSAEGPWHYRLFRGEFRGDYTDPYYLGVAHDSNVDPLIRASQGVGGYLKVGDRFEDTNAGTNGSYIGQVVATAGWVAPRSWAAALDVDIYNYYGAGCQVGDGRPSTMVHPTVANGYSYVACKRGTTHASTQPTWVTSYLGSGGIVPVCWRSGVKYKVGDYGRPSTPNGHYYRVTAVASADVNGYATVGVSEPTWNTGGGATTTDGNVTWTEQGSDVGTYNTDGTTIWQCVGPVPTFRNYARVVDTHETGVGWINVKDYGAKGDGVTDDTAAVQAAVTAAKAAGPINSLVSGITLYFPHGVYLISSALNFDYVSSSISQNWPSVTLLGDGGGQTNRYRAATTLLFTGTGTGAFISARSTAGFTIRQMSVIYNSASFTGTLIDFSHSAAANDSTNMTVRDCTIGSDNGSRTTAKNLILLDGANCGTFENIVFYGAVAAIRGIGGSGYTVEYASGQSNRHTIHACSFDGCTLAAIVNPPTQGLVVSNCTFEGNAMPTAIAADYTSLGTCQGMKFVGNWLGDTINGNDGTAWISNNGNLAFYGAAFDNNFFVSTSGAKDSIQLGPSFGVSIAANVIGTIDFRQISGGSFPQGVSVTGNYLLGSNTSTSPFFRGLEAFSGATFQTMQQMCRVHIAGNNSTSLGTLDHWNIAGHIVASPTLNTAPQLSGVTNITPTLEGDGNKGSNDTAGRITLVSTGSAAGSQCTLTFAVRFDGTYGHVPKVVLQAETSAAAEVMSDVYVTPAVTGFSIVSISGLPAGTYTWAYHVIG